MVKTEHAVVVGIELQGGLAVAESVWAWYWPAVRIRGLSVELRDDSDIAVSYERAVPPEVEAADAEFVRGHRAGLAALVRFVGASQSPRRARRRAASARPMESADGPLAELPGWSNATKESPRRTRRRRAGAGRTVESGDEAASR
jgi:hypothetical protein